MSAGAQDPRLAAFLGAESDREAEVALAAIFDEATDRLLVDAVRRALIGSPRRAADAEDIASETRLRLIRRLWTLRREGGEPIEDFAAYVSTTATRSCYAYLRERFPARTRFRNQVRYSVSKHPETSLEVSGAVWLCRTLRLATSRGDAARSGQAPHLATPRSDAARSGQGPRLVPFPGSQQQFIDAPAAFLARERIDPALPLPRLIASLLARLDAPIELDRLVDALAVALGIVDAKPAPGGDHGDALALERVPDQSPGTLRALSDREALEALWREVTELPINQRVALLLNLRDPDGGAALHALPVTGLVTMAGLARALELDDAELAGLWDRLPLDDLTIASRLGVTRQQVINLRKSARARLARRTER